MAERVGSDDESEVYFTTHQVAKFLGVSVPTIVNWVNEQRLKAHRTPGGHRRIAQSEVVSFAKAHGFPLPRTFWQRESTKVRIVLVDDDAPFADTVREYLTAMGEYEIEVARTPFEAGFHIGRRRPDVVICDPRVVGLDTLALVEWIRGHDELRDVVLIACTMTDDAVRAERVEEACDELLEKPIRLQTLFEVIQRRLAG